MTDAIKLAEMILENPTIYRKYEIELSNALLAANRVVEAARIVAKRYPMTCDLVYEEWTGPANKLSDSITAFDAEMEKGV